MKRTKTNWRFRKCLDCKKRYRIAN